MMQFFEAYNENEKLSPVVRELHPKTDKVFKTNYVLDFLALLSNFSEKSLRKSIIENLKHFILEFGKDFTFVGEEYRVQVGLKDFYIDEIIEYIKNSSWADIVKSNKQLNDADSIKKLVGSTMVKRNIAIKHSDDKYSFTKAYKLFIDFTRELIKSELNQNSTN